MTRKRIMGLVTFDGERDPDVEAAVAELRRAGFGVVRMEEKFRRLLHHPRDDFVEVSIDAELSSDDLQKLSADERKIVDKFRQKVDAIVAGYRAEADSFGLAQPGELPLAVVFGRELVAADEALAAEIDKRDGEMWWQIERARNWDRLG